MKFRDPVELREFPGILLGTDKVGKLFVAGVDVVALPRFIHGEILVHKVAEKSDKRSSSTGGG